MSMSFSRKETQLYFEKFYNCGDNLNSWNNCRFKDYVVDYKGLEELIPLCQNDAYNYYYNGILTLSEALRGLRNRNYSWSVIKLYYSVYYLIRASMYINNITFIRQKQLYYLELKEGASPTKKSNNNKYNSDHQGTIWHYFDLFNKADILLSNKIDEKESYIWLMDKRELVNYRINKFQEPSEYSFLSYYIDNNFDKNFRKIILEQIDDPYIQCFQKETAILALPIKRLLETNKDFKKTLPNKQLLSDSQYDYIKKIIGDEVVLRKLSE